MIADIAAAEEWRWHPSVTDEDVLELSDVRAFQHVLRDIQVAPTEVFFTDDTTSKLAGAEGLSMQVHRFRGVRHLRSALLAAGVAVSRHRA